MGSGTIGGCLATEKHCKAQDFKELGKRVNCAKTDGLILAIYTSFDRFSHSWQTVPTLYDGLALFPSKLPCLHGGSGSPWPIYTWFLGFTRCPHLKWHLDWFGHFCRAQDHERQTDRPTDRQTDRPRYSICNSTPHLCSTAMRPNDNNKKTAVY